MFQFSSSFHFNNQDFHTHFSEIVNLSSSRYHIKVQGSNGDVTAFDMSRNNRDNWVICPPAPEWILARTSWFTSLIMEHCKEKSLV